MQQKYSSFCILTKQATHAVQNQNCYKRAIVNDRKAKSSRIHVLCDDVQFFFTRGQKISLQSALHGTSSNAIRAKTSSKKTSKRRTGRKKPRKRAKMTQLRFCVRWTQKRGPKPLKKLRGAANLQSSQKISISCACKQNQDAFSRSSRMQLLHSPD